MVIRSAVLAGWAALAGAQPMPPTSAPTAFACTAQTLESGTECYFETAAAPEVKDARKQRAANVDVLKKLVPSLCAAAVKREPGRPAATAEAKRCVLESLKVANDCGLDGAAPIVDGEGRFHPLARACYQALGDVLAERRTAAATSPLPPLKPEARGKDE